MTEEFANILNEIKKKPFEEKLDVITDVFEKVMFLFLKIPTLIDNELNSIQQQINSIKIQINQIKQKITIKDLPKIKTLTPLPPPPPPPNSTNINEPAIETRKVIMDELQELLKKRKENLGEQ